MNGLIVFETWAEVGEFLKAFAGSSATFEVKKVNDNRIELYFDGGY